MGYRPPRALVRDLVEEVGRLPNDRTRLRLAKESLMGLFLQMLAQMSGEGLWVEPQGNGF